MARLKDVPRNRLHTKCDVILVVASSGQLRLQQRLLVCCQTVQLISRTVIWFGWIRCVISKSLKVGWERKTIEIDLLENVAAGR